MKSKGGVYIFIFCLLSVNVIAQKSNIPLLWHLQPCIKDSFYGINLTAAYSFLQQKNIQPQPIVVGVIDSGIDTTHEALKNNLWRNSKEIINGKDDDGNGYIDDVFGWNFLQDTTSNNAAFVDAEIARVYHYYNPVFQNKKIDTAQLSPIEKQAYITWQNACQHILPTEEDKMNADILGRMIIAVTTADSVLQQALNTHQYSLSELKKKTVTNALYKNAKFNFLQIATALEKEDDETNTDFIKELKETAKHLQRKITAPYLSLSSQQIQSIKNNYTNLNLSYGGNNNVHNDTLIHGTHVAGIIAANSVNNNGAAGVCPSAKIMAIKAVPDGDEYDKNIALAILYAVKNGAKVINMSFGKSYSPQKYWVDSALLFAQKNDVLIVCAAGNEALNIDENISYPNAVLLNNQRLTNVITVGASSSPAITKDNVIAYFTNYGFQRVDVFAPGVKIYSPVPLGNKYSKQEGTSMAAPVVSGLAALLRSSFPTLTAAQTKAIIELSVYAPEKEYVYFPNNIDKVLTPTTFKNLCKTGGIVNAEKAVQLAFDMLDKDNKN